MEFDRYTDEILNNYNKKPTNTGGLGKNKAFWGNRGAGVLIQAKSTGRYLLGLRSQGVNEPNTWGIFGGKIDENESSKDAAKREVYEELRYNGPIDLHLLHLYKKDDFRFFNYLGIVKDEFTPKLDWENTDAQWFEKNEFPEPLHFGLKRLLRFI